MRWVVHAACVGEKRNTYRIFVEKSEGKGRLRRLKPTRLRAVRSGIRIPAEPNIYIFSETSIPSLANHKGGWRALMNTAINAGVPKNAGNFLTS
jgi:hypothetical protein